MVQLVNKRKKALEHYTLGSQTLLASPYGRDVLKATP